MNKTIHTPHLTFRPRVIRQMLSEQVSADNRLAQDVAQPLFDAGISSAAIAEKKQYVSSMGSREYHDLRILLQGQLHAYMDGHHYDLTPGDLMVCPVRTPMRCSAGKKGAWFLYFQNPRPAGMESVQEQRQLRSSI